MELESKFIEGTNNQYSIRNDGAVISNYIFNSLSNKKIFKEKILKISSINTVCLNTGKTKITRSTQTLLFNAFKYKFCVECNNKHYIKQDRLCNTCKKADKRKASVRYSENTIKSSKKKTELLTKSYVALRIGIPVNVMPEELYQEYKILIQVKRLIAQKLNCSINSIK